MFECEQSFAKSLVLFFVLCSCEVDKVVFSEKSSVPGVPVIYRTPEEKANNPDRLNLDRYDEYALLRRLHPMNIHQILCYQCLLKNSYTTENCLKEILLKQLQWCSSLCRGSVYQLSHWEI